MTMTANELALFKKHLNRARHYLEFGSGHSTLQAVQADNISQIDSVESSETYIRQQLLPHLSIQKALNTQRLTFHLVDLGETIEWGTPKNNLKRHLWPNYALAVFTKQSQHDLVLIDGRFRVASTLSCILNTPPQTPLIIHDFWNRSEYFILLKFLTPLEKVDSMGIFRAKKELDRHEVQQLIQIYQYHPNDKPHNIKVKISQKPQE